MMTMMMMNDDDDGDNNNYNNNNNNNTECSDAGTFSLSNLYSGFNSPSIPDSISVLEDQTVEQIIII